MISKAIAKLLIGINVVSFVLVTLFLLVVWWSMPNLPTGNVYGIQERVLTTLIFIALLFANIFAHGLIAIAGACLLELERTRKLLQDIKAIWIPEQQSR